MDKGNYHNHHQHHFGGHGRPNFRFPPPHVNVGAMNNMIAGQNNGLQRRNWNVSNLPPQQFRYGHREDAVLRDDIRRTRRRLSEMEKKIVQFETQENSESQNKPEALKEPQLYSWLVQQRQNCELWNQNLALKECLRNVGQENNALRQMCRQKEANIFALEKKASDLKAQLKLFTDIQDDVKRVDKAFNFKSEKELEAGSYKCTCGQC